MLEDYDTEEQLLAERLLARWPRLTEAERNSLRDVLGPKPVTVEGMVQTFGSMCAHASATVRTNGLVCDDCGTVVLPPADRLAPVTTVRFDEETDHAD